MQTIERAARASRRCCAGLRAGAPRARSPAARATRVFDAGEQLFREGDAGRRVLPDPRRARSRSRSTSRRAAPLVIETLARRRARSAGRGCSRPTAGTFDARALEHDARDRASTAPACAASARPTTSSATSCMQLLRGGRSSSACRPPGCSCSTSMATSRRLSRDRGRWCPRRSGSRPAPGDRATRGRSSSSRRRRRALAFAPGQFTMLYALRRRRGADLDQRRSRRRGARSCTRSARSARPRAAICAARAGRRARRARPVRPRWPVERRPRARDVRGRRRRHRPRAAAPGDPPRCSRAASATARVALLYGGRAPDQLLYADELERWRGARRSTST